MSELITDLPAKKLTLYLGNGNQLSFIPEKDFMRVVVSRPDNSGKWSEQMQVRLGEADWIRLVRWINEPTTEG